MHDMPGCRIHVSAVIMLNLGCVKFIEKISCKNPSLEVSIHLHTQEKKEIDENFVEKHKDRETKPRISYTPPTLKRQQVWGLIP